MSAAAVIGNKQLLVNVQYTSGGQLNAVQPQLLDVAPYPQLEHTC